MKKELNDEHYLPGTLADEVPVLAVTREEAAFILGVSRPRISQLLAAGMPFESGLIPVERALTWYVANVTWTASNMVARDSIEARLDTWYSQQFKKHKASLDGQAKRKRQAKAKATAKVTGKGKAAKR